MNIEEYRAVLQERYPNCLEVSNLGNIKLLRSEKITIGYPDKDGYLYITSPKGFDHRTTLKVHRLVAMAFLPNPNNKRCVNHIDGNKTNNWVGNLEWSTHSENMRHAVDKELNTACKKRGEAHNTAKFSWIDICAIRAMYRTGVFSMRILAKIWNTSSGYISDVINRRIRIDE